MSANSSEAYEKIKEAKGWIERRAELVPRIYLTLGSGLSEALEGMEAETTINWKDIPGFPLPTIEGHTGELVLGRLAGKKVILQKGRVHWYEGKSMKELVFPTRLARTLGAETMIVTNAAGGIKESFQPGDLVLIKDHINASGHNPLRGPNIEELGDRFPDMSAAYDPDLRALSRQVAEEIGVDLKEGVYAMTPGPSFETPAEIVALRRMGADLAGMSTVPEVIAARHCGLNVLGISCVTNKAAGMQERLSHEEVIASTEKAQGKFSFLIEELVDSF